MVIISENLVCAYVTEAGLKCGFEFHLRDTEHDAIVRATSIGHVPRDVLSSLSLNNKPDRRQTGGS